MILSAFIATICLSANSQILTTNNESDENATNTNVQNVVTVNDDEKHDFSYFGLVYYGFDGFSNYALSGGGVNPNGFGYDLAFRVNFEEHGNKSWDILPNYSFGLMRKGPNQLAITIAAGPSIRLQDEFAGIDKSGKAKYDFKTSVDAIINPKLTVKLGHLTLYGGYFYWAPKFKFSKNDGATGGFNIGIFYSSL